MGKPHYVVRRSRLGRFNFALLADHGRLTGMVVVATENRTKPEIEHAANAKIRALAAELLQALTPDDPA